MRTLPNNYKRNIEILKENIKRGMTEPQARNSIQALEAQFKRAGLYGKDERVFIDEMSSVLDEAFVVRIKATDLMESMNVNVVNM